MPTKVEHLESFSHRTESSRMNDKIIEIKEFSTDKYDGFYIKTDKQVIKFGISNGQDCCEHWGSISSNDDFSDFIGAEILEIKTMDTDKNLNVLVDMPDDVHLESCMFINVETTADTLQFVLYNEHNGYYGHSVVIESEQLKYQGGL